MCVGVFARKLVDFCRRLPPKKVGKKAERERENFRVDGGKRNFDFPTKLFFSLFSSS